MRISFTVATTARRVAYAGNGITTNFAVPFQFFADTDLRVVAVITATGVETTLTLGVDYTATGGVVAQQPGTGFVIATTAPASGITWVIEGASTGAQTADYQQNDPFPAETNEEALDRATIVAQEAVLRAKQSPKLPATYNPAFDPIAIPIPEPGKFLRGRGDAKGWEHADLSSVPTSANAVFYTPGGVDGVTRSVQDRLRETVSVKDYGAQGNGVTDDTLAFNRAFAGGGHVLVPPGDYVVSSATASVDGTRLIGLGNARIVSKSGSTTDVIRAWCNDFEVEGLTFVSTNAPDLNSSLWIAGHRYKVRNCKFYGGTFNLRLPNTNAPGPTYAVYVAGSTDYAMYEDGVIEDVYVQGGNNGVVIQGGKRVSVRNVTCFLMANFGMIIGRGLSMIDFQMTGFRGICCGQYGFSNAGMFGAAGVEPVPMSGMMLSNMYAENTGWNSYLSGINGAIGSGKFGFDITDNGLNGFSMKAAARNCCVGGMESKGNTFDASTGYKTTKTTNASTASGSVLPFASTSNVYKGMTVAGTNIPTDTYVQSLTATTVTLTRAISGTVANGATITFTTNVQPAGHRNVNIEFEYITNLDNSQVAVGLFQSDTSVASTYHTNHNVRVSAITESPVAWRSGLYKKPGDMVTVSGYTWMALGTTTGLPGTTGQTTPSGTYEHNSVTTNSATASGDTLHFASTTGIQTGMVVFGLNIPDGTTVVTVGANDVELSNDVTGSGVANGARVIIAALHYDGGMYWLGMGADDAAASQNNRAMTIQTCNNVTAIVDSVGCSRGLFLTPAGGTDNTIAGLKATVRARSARYGIELTGSGSIVLTNATFVNCDIEADYGFYSSASAGTFDYEVLGGRFIGLTYGFRINNGTNNVRFDGGVHIKNATARALYVPNGTNTLKCGAATFEGSASVNAPVVDFAGGSGTMDWGNAIIVNNNANVVPGWRTTGGTMSTRGNVLRQDLSTAPSTTTRGNVGEFMYLAVPGAVRGYVCVAADFVTPLFTWRALMAQSSVSGSVTQLTNKSTGVTLNASRGTITLEATDTINAGAAKLFTFTNSFVEANDFVSIAHEVGGTGGAYCANVGSITGGSCEVRVTNISTGNLTEAPILRFMVHKGTA